MSHAIQIHQYGGPEVLRWETVAPETVSAGHVRLRQTAIGLNFIDTYYRSGLYPTTLPSGLGLEGAGIIEELGAEVSDLQLGQRVAYAGGPLGAYAQQRVMPADKLIPIPEGISDEQAAAMMLQGLTAWYLLRHTFVVKPGDTVLIHAAAGGVGLIACQWARHLGATVIGTVGSAEKAALAQAHGCQHTILYREQDFVSRVRELTDGYGVDVVYDGVGKDTFMGSLDCLRRMGMMVSYGNASGAPPAIEPLLLAQKGSLFLTRPVLMHYTARREELLAGAQELFEVVLNGTVKIEVPQRYPLAEAAQAHADLEARRTTGSTVLLP